MSELVEIEEFFQDVYEGGDANMSISTLLKPYF
jgi:hypothetical protein